MESTKLVVILALVAAVALTGAVTMMTEQVEGASHKSFGQCNKNANKANHAANVTGKAGSDARKASCKPLKPGK